MGSRLLGALATALAGAVLLVAPGVAAATTYAVTTTSDSPPGGYTGVCTTTSCPLRQAVASANVGPGNIIKIPSGSYSLNGANGELVLSQDMTIVGDGARSTTITISGGGRLFIVQSHVAMSGLTLKGGVAPQGGALLVDIGGRLDLSGSTLTGNKANGGNGFPPTGEGGGIYNQGTLNVSASTINDNHVTAGLFGNTVGGGIDTPGPATLTNVTIQGNSADGGVNSGGGGVSGSGGNPVVTIVNSTITGNSVTGTTAKGGNVDLGSMGSLLNTIVAGGVAQQGFDNCSAPVTSQGHNIEQATDQCGFHASGDKVSTDALLGLLQNNAGQTDTRALLPGSPAIDAGANTGCPGTDQRGVTRPQGAACDIGAFEFTPPTVLPPAGGGGLVVLPGATRIVDLFKGATLAKRLILVSGKFAIVVQKCPANTPGFCLVNDTLAADTSLPRIEVTGARKKKSHKPRKIGSKTATIKPGKTAKVKIKLSKAALKKLKKKHRLKSTLTVVSSDQLKTTKTVKTNVTLALQKAKKKRKR